MRSIWGCISCFSCFAGALLSACVDPALFVFEPGASTGSVLFALGRESRFSALALQARADEPLPFSKSADDRLWALEFRETPQELGLSPGPFRVSEPTECSEARRFPEPINSRVAPSASVDFEERPTPDWLQTLELPPLSPQACAPEGTWFDTFPDAARCCSGARCGEAPAIQSPASVDHAPPGAVDPALPGPQVEALGSCDPGTFYFYGLGCAPVSPTCAEEWPQALPAEALYVAPDGGAGPCTRDQPCASIEEALARPTQTQTVIALSAGVFPTAVRLDRTTRLVGVCAQRVRLIAPEGASEVLEVVGEVSLEGLTIEGGSRGISIQEGGVLDAKSVSIKNFQEQGVLHQGELSFERVAITAGPLGIVSTASVARIPRATLRSVHFSELDIAVHLVPAWATIEGLVITAVRQGIVAGNFGIPNEQFIARKVLIADVEGAGAFVRDIESVEMEDWTIMNVRPSHPELFAAGECSIFESNVRLLRDGPEEAIDSQCDGLALFSRVEHSTTLRRILLSGIEGVGFTLDGNIDVVLVEDLVVRDVALSGMLLQSHSTVRRAEFIDADLVYRRRDVAFEDLRIVNGGLFFRPFEQVFSNRFQLRDFEIQGPNALDLVLLEELPAADFDLREGRIEGSAKLPSCAVSAQTLGLENVSFRPGERP